MSNPTSHTHDPPTSREAAGRHEQSGRRTANAAVVLAIVKRHPGKTACELYELATAEERGRLKELQEVRRRCTDLLAAGLVRQGGPRRCAVKGSRQMTWHAEPVRLEQAELFGG